MGLLGFVLKFLSPAGTGHATRNQGMPCSCVGWSRVVFFPFGQSLQRMTATREDYVKQGKHKCSSVAVSSCARAMRSTSYVVEGMIGEGGILTRIIRRLWRTSSATLPRATVSIRNIPQRGRGERASVRAKWWNFTFS